MSKTITSYFTVIPKSKTGQSSSAVQNNDKKKNSKFQSSEEEKERSLSPKKRQKTTKRKIQISSDSEDEVTVVKEKLKKGHSGSGGTKNERDGNKNASRSKSPKKISSEPSKRSAKRHVLSDSEDEVTELLEQKSKKLAANNEEKISPKKAVSVADMFDSKPVKRVEAPKVSKKVSEEDGEFYCDADFEAALNQVETSTIGKTTNGDGKTKEPVKNTTGSKKEDGKLKKPSNSDDSFDEKRKKDDRNNKVEKVSEDEKRTSKHFENVKPMVKDESKKSIKALESSKASASSKKPNDTSYKKGISKITIDKTPGQKRKRSNEEEDDNDPFEAIVQKKQRSAALYQQYLHRGGARNPGSKEIPTGADNCLAGLSFLITGVLDSMEREEADDLIKKYGGRIMAQVSRKTDYVILGDEPGPSKLEKAKNFGVKMISEDELLELIRKRPAGHAKTEDKHNFGKKKTPRKVKERTPEAEPLTSTNESEKKIENGSKAELEIFGNKQKTLSDDRASTSKGNEVSKRGDIPPVIRPPCETGSQVWVEKYKPKSMKQIIGQQGDKSNANKLHNWLKNWQKNQTGNVKRARPSPWAQHDGSFFKAVLLSGPPGVGKTTTVQVVCEALGLDALEFNASDTRSKRLLKEEVSELLSNKSMRGYCTGDHSKKPDLNHVLVMDEVDGMAGNEDRGGLQELISLIKTTNVPVICICNDRNNPKMRTLANYTYDLKFQKPRIEQIKSAMMSVCFKENIKIPPEDLTRLIESTNNDVRQVLNHLSLLAGNPSANETQRGRKINKDLRLGPWDVVQKVFTHEAHKTMTIHDKSDLFFHDYNIAPLFVQENYLGVVPNCPKDKVLETVANAAESLALGDLVENAIRRSGAWGLLPTQACYSSVIPGTLMSGHISRQITFPSWLGQNSRRGKFDRLLQEITVHTRLATSASKDSINLDYLKHLRDAVVRPLVTQGSDGASLALEAMNYYNLLREDLDSLAEVSLWPGNRDPMQSLDSKVKAAFTRAFNKNSTMRPYAVTKGAEKKKRAQTSSQEEALDFELEEADDEEEEDEDIASSDPMIKVKKASAATTSSKKGGSTSEKGSTGSKKKNNNSRGGGKSK